MARLKRVILPGFPHHVTQRGNHKEPIFTDYIDRYAYLRMLKSSLDLYNVKISAFCLMTNHVHLILIPSDEKGLPECMRRVQGLYARYFNDRMNLVGHLWQERFYSCAMDEQHNYRAIRYIESNPVRAKITEKAYRFEWSTAAWRCGLMKVPGHLTLNQEHGIPAHPEWKDELLEGFDDLWVKSFWQRTTKGTDLIGSNFKYDKRGRPKHLIS